MFKYLKYLTKVLCNDTRRAIVKYTVSRFIIYDIVADVDSYDRSLDCEMLIIIDDIFYLLG